MNEAKHTEMMAHIESLYSTKSHQEIVVEIEKGYIFGPYGSNEHFSRDEISALVQEVELIHNPIPEPTVEEPAIEEPIVEEPTNPEV